jgi:CheY-like chemotaxis protein
MKRINCILLVDDDESDNFFHQLTITEADLCNQLKIATDGAKALDYILKSGDPDQSLEFPRPDIIFLDINMPRMNGFEFLEEYNKLDQKFKSHILIVMLTTTLNPHDEQKALEFEGVSEFRNKPLTTEMLCEIVEAYF